MHSQFTASDVLCPLPLPISLQGSMAASVRLTESLQHFSNHSKYIMLGTNN